MLDFRFRQLLREKLDGRDAEDLRQALNGAGSNIFTTPFDALIPFQIRLKHVGDLFLRQVVPPPQFAKSRSDKTEQQHNYEAP